MNRWRAAAAGLAALVLASWVALAVSWSRAAAYDEVFAENLDLKQRLEDIDRKMAEVDRILLRLRLYDAQLDSFAAPRGDHGPVEADAASPSDLDEGWLDGPPADGDGFSTTTQWVDGVDGRLAAFLASFERLEYGLTRVVEDLEQVHALRAALPSIWPAEGILSSDYGWRRSPWNRRWTHHSGIDIAGTTGDAIRATAAGRVVLADWDQGYGKAVRIDHGFGIQTLYAHNSRIFVREGDRVTAGQPIAAMGSTGRSTGPHCHFELSVDGHEVDPLQYLEPKGDPGAPPRKR